MAIRTFGNVIIPKTSFSLSSSNGSAAVTAKRTVQFTNTQIASYLGIPYFLLPYHFAGQPNSIIVCVQERGGGKVEEQNPPFTLKPFI